MGTRLPPSAAPRADRRGGLPDRFHLLVHSPLRAAILRFVNAHPSEAYDIEGVMHALGRLRPDVENCVRELASFGLLRREEGPPARFGAVRPGDPALQALLDEFLGQRPTATTEDQSEAVQRFRDMIGHDEKMLVVFEWVRTSAKSDISVLILGPTGSGKEVVARMIHDLSPRRGARLQAINCAALPDTLFESEIFGHERGAFTGASARKLGRLELANHGTLFLDEIADLSPASQAKLLRVLEEHRFERLGGERSIEVDFRLISATNRPLDTLVRDGRFREDLYYRVNTFLIRLPSLRERSVDIPLLAGRFLAGYCTDNGLAPDAKTFAPDAIDALCAHGWPGNIRELESTVSRAALSSDDAVIRASDLQFLTAAVPTSVAPDGPLLSLSDAERAHILRVLDTVGWNKQEAARILQIGRATLYRKLEEYGLTVPGAGGSGLA